MYWQSRALARVIVSTHVRWESKRRQQSDTACPWLPSGRWTAWVRHQMFTWLLWSTEAQEIISDDKLHHIYFGGELLLIQISFIAMHAVYGTHSPSIYTPNITTRKVHARVMCIEDVENWKHVKWIYCHDCHRNCGIRTISWSRRMWWWARADLPNQSYGSFSSDSFAWIRFHHMLL